MTRIKNTTSDPEERQKTLKFIGTKFTNRDYPKPLITSTQNSLTSTGSKRQPPSSILRLPYVKRSHMIKGIVSDTWNTIVTDPALTSMFPSAPMVTYTRHRNLANYLCRSSSPGTVTEGPNLTTLTEPPIQPRVHPCNHPYCKCCPQLYQTYNLHGTPLTQHLNCKSKNVVYLIKCRLHPKHMYVGQTSRQLNQRLASHRASFLNPGTKSTWPLYKHFSNTTHTKEDILISPLVSVLNKDLLRTEAYWINLLRTYRWPGLNSAHSLDYLTH